MAPECSRAGQPALEGAQHSAFSFPPPVLMLPAPSTACYTPNRGASTSLQLWGEGVGRLQVAISTTHKELPNPGGQTGCGGASQTAGKDYVRCKVTVTDRPAGDLGGGDFITHESQPRPKELQKAPGGIRRGTSWTGCP